MKQSEKLRNVNGLLELTVHIVGRDRKTGINDHENLIENIIIIYFYFYNFYSICPLICIRYLYSHYLQ